MVMVSLTVHIGLVSISKYCRTFQTDYVDIELDGLTPVPSSVPNKNPAVARCTFATALSYLGSLLWCS